MAWFRCHNDECCEDTGGLVQYDFEGKSPTCPKCGLTGEKERVVQISTIHYDPPHPRLGSQGFGTNFIACNPKTPVTRLGKNHCATGVADVVNCSNCKATEVFKANVPDPYGDIVPERKVQLDGRGIQLQEKIEAELAERGVKIRGDEPLPLPEEPDPTLFEDGCC